MLYTKILPSILALGLASTLNASSFFLDDKEDTYSQLHNDIVQLFNSDSFLNNTMGALRMNMSASYPKMNVFENKEKYIFKFELAGIDKKDIKVTISDQNILTVTGKKKELSKEEKKDIIRQEHYYGSFSRSISLPDDINTDKIKVKYDNGILNVSVDKDIQKIKNKIKTLSID